MIRTQRTFFDRSLSRAFRRRLAREGARGWAARRLLVGGVLFLCCQARLAGDMAPFAPACFAAGLSAGWSPPAMLVGVALGALAAGGSSSALPMASPMAALMMPLGCGLIWALWKALQRLAPRFPRGASGRDEGLPSEDAWVAGLAGLAALPPAIAGSPSPAAAVCALIAAPLAPTLTSALRVGPGRRLLMPDERLSLTLLMMVLVAGVHALPLIGQPLGLAAAALLSLAAAGLGPAAGAVGGLSLGLAIAATGGDAAVGAVLGLSAMAAGAVRGLARPAQAASFVACALVAVSYLSGGQAPGGAAIAPIALAALGYCLIPLPPLKRAWALLDPSRRRRVDPERLGQRLGDGARRRVHGVAAVFRALAGGYAAPARPDDEQAFIQAMRSRLCEGCAGYEGCWCGDERRALRLMEKLLGDALSGRLALSAADLPPDVCRQCRRAPQIEKRLSSMLAEFAARRAAEQGRAECRALCARQFSQAAELMHRLSAQLAHPVALDERCATLAAAALDREGLPAAEVMALVGERTEIAAVLSKGTWSAAAARRAARRLSEELGLPLQPLLSLGDGPEGELRFVEVPRLCVTAAVASRPHTAGQPSGDTATSRPLPGGRHMLALSDGMGSGAAAAAESAGAVALLGTFLAADVDKPLALESINGLMMLGGGDDMFATVDLCVIDLMSGEASFHKLGACASAVLRGREVIRVAGGRLPLGILEQVKPTQTTITLRPGDRVVMVSDGVADPTRPGQQEWLDALLEGMAATQPRQLSERILQAAVGRDGGPTDDMTVLVAQIERADEKFW